VVTFHARNAIGLRPPDPRRLTHRSAAEATTDHEGLTEHWTGSGGQLYRPDPIQRLRAIQAFHMDQLGYGDIAYNAAYDADGNVYGLRDHAYVSAHAASVGNRANRLTDGICWLEDVRGFTAAAGAAYRWCVQFYELSMRRAPQLFTHHYWGDQGAPGLPTACPGPVVRSITAYLGGAD